jgi:hypothetical protein
VPSRGPVRASCQRLYCFRASASGGHAQTLLLLTSPRLTRRQAVGSRLCVAALRDFNVRDLLVGQQDHRDVQLAPSSPLVISRTLKRSPSRATTTTLMALTLFSSVARVRAGEGLPLARGETPRVSRRSGNGLLRNTGEGERASGRVGSHRARALFAQHRGNRLRAYGHP